MQSTRNHLGPAFREPGAEKSGCVFTAIHLLTLPMCDMTYIASYTLLLETNLPSEDLRLYRQY